MDQLIMQPIGVIINERAEIEDDNWANVVSAIELNAELPEDALDGIETFSHIEVIFFFDRVPEAKIVSGARHPRNNLQWPRVGIFAQRGKNRPNRIGATIVAVRGRQGRTLYVQGLDAINGTPVLDIKPVMREFLPREPVAQPAWVEELMLNYW